MDVGFVLCAILWVAVVVAVTRDGMGLASWMANLTDQHGLPLEQRLRGRWSIMLLVEGACPPDVLIEAERLRAGHLSGGEPVQLVMVTADPQINYPADGQLVVVWGCSIDLARFADKLRGRFYVQTNLIGSASVFSVLVDPDLSLVDDLRRLSSCSTAGAGSTPMWSID